MKGLANEIRLFRMALTGQSSDTFLPSPSVEAPPSVAHDDVHDNLPASRAVLDPPVSTTFPRLSQSGKTKVMVVSAGHGAGDVADFLLDNQPIAVRGPEGRRGLNVVVIDPTKGNVVSATSYDLWGDTDQANKQLAEALNKVPPGYYILAALKDSGMEKLSLDAMEALEEFGATIESRLDFREGYALIGVKGASALGEKRGPQMLLLDVVLPFSVQQAVQVKQSQSFAQSQAASQPVAHRKSEQLDAAQAAPLQPISKVESDALAAQKDCLQRDMDLARERNGNANMPRKTWEEILVMLDLFVESQSRGSSR